MKAALERYAPAALIVSGLAVLVALGVGLMKVLQAIGLYLPPNPEWMISALQLSALFFALGLAVYTIILPDKVRAFLSGRQVRYGSNVLVVALAFVGILVVLNILTFQNPRSWDLTQNKARSLAPETTQLLETLPEQIEAIGFYSSNAPLDTAEELLLGFKANSNGKFDYQFLDPDLNPVVAQNAGITGDGKILLQMGERQEIAAFASEQELVRAMIRLVSPGERAVYFLTGHGERDIQLPSEAAITRASQALLSKNYTVLPLNLRAVDRIPDDALAIIIAGATEPIPTDEIVLLDKFLAAGGGLVVMADPVPLTSFSGSDDSLGDYLAQGWQIVLQNDLIVDPTVNPPLDAVSYRYGDHPITQKMNNVLTFFPFVRSLQFSEMENITYSPLVWSIDNSWSESDLSFLESESAQPQFDEGEDLSGSLLMAIAAENGVTNGRVVVFGNSEFASDSYFASYGNGDLLINAIDWVAEQEDLISLTPKEQVERTFIVPNNGQIVSILIGTICLLPGAMLVGGFAAWMRRRRRG